MSLDILQLRVWSEGTLQNNVPANDNSLRLEALMRPCLGVANDGAGGDSSGDVWIVGSAPTGAFATFNENDIAIFRQGVWYAWAPVVGLRTVVADVRKVFNGTGWIDDPSIGGAVDSVNSKTGAVVLELGDLDDVNTSGASDRDVLRWDDTAGKWVPEAPGSGDRSTVTVLSTSGTVNIDVLLGDYFTLVLSGNVTSLTFSNLPGSGKGVTLMVRITQGSTAKTVAWPASFKWAGGTPGAISTASGAVDVLAITTFDNGTTWIATLAKAFA